MCNSYDEWKHCITVKCKIPITADYVSKRISALQDMRDPMTSRFVQLYGDAYRLRVIEWFERAGAEVASPVGPPG